MSKPRIVYLDPDGDVQIEPAASAYTYDQSIVQFTRSDGVRMWLPWHRVLQVSIEPVAKASAA